MPDGPPGIEERLSTMARGLGCMARGLGWHGIVETRSCVRNQNAVDVVVDHPGAARRLRRAGPRSPLVNR